MSQISPKVLSFRWSGFTDIEEGGYTAHHSGILSYQVAVGENMTLIFTLNLHRLRVCSFFKINSNVIFDLVNRCLFVSVSAFFHAVCSLNIVYVKVGNITDNSINVSERQKRKTLKAYAICFGLHMDVPSHFLFKVKNISKLPQLLF